MSKRDQYRKQASHIIQEAWEINGTPAKADPVEEQLRILNGLLAIALTEFTARPKGGGKSGFAGSIINLRDVLAEEVEIVGHVVSSGPNAPLQCSIDDGYLDWKDKGRDKKTLLCEKCGRWYTWFGGRQVKGPTGE